MYEDAKHWFYGFVIMNKQIGSVRVRALSMFKMARSIEDRLCEVCKLCISLERAHGMTPTIRVSGPASSDGYK